MHSCRRVAVLPMLAAVLLGCRPAPTTLPVSPTPQPAAPTGTVTLEIKTGETTQTIQVPDVQQGTTLETLMRSIDQVPVTVHGSGVTAFVDEIGDTSTAGTQGWTFRVDGEFANQGIGSIELSPPTTITWSYADASEIVED